jgi:hypothetical protein
VETGYRGGQGSPRAVASTGRQAVYRYRPCDGMNPRLRSPTDRVKMIKKTEEETRAQQRAVKPFMNEWMVLYNLSILLPFLLRSPDGLRYVKKGICRESFPAHFLLLMKDLIYTYITWSISAEYHIPQQGTQDCRSGKSTYCTERWMWLQYVTQYYFSKFMLSSFLQSPLIRCHPQLRCCSYVTRGTEEKNLIVCPSYNKIKLRGRSPEAKYTVRVTAACQRS